MSWKSLAASAALVGAVGCGGDAAVAPDGGGAGGSGVGGEGTGASVGPSGPASTSAQTTTSSASSASTASGDVGGGGQGGAGSGGDEPGSGGADPGSGGAGAGGTGAGGTGGGAPQPKPITNPVYPNGAPDPAVIKVGSTWHAYSTSAGGKHILHLSSTNLQKWTVVGDALPKINTKWIDGADPQTWAPGIVRISATRYVLYYAAHVKGTEKRHCIGRGVAKSPDGPFVDDYEAPLVCTGATAWAIDPSPFVDADGTLYLTWRQDEGGNSHVAVRKMGPMGEHFAPNTTTKLVLHHTKGSWEDSPSPEFGDLIENPAMVRIAKGKYVLFYSGNSWQTADYATGYAWCDSPTGPCTKKTTQKPWLSTDSPNAPWVNAAGKMKGPGGLETFPGPNGETWAIWHAWVDKIAAQDGKRKLFLGKLTFGPNGTPTVSQGKF